MPHDEAETDVDGIAVSAWDSPPPPDIATWEPPPQDRAGRPEADYRAALEAMRAWASKNMRHVSERSLRRAFARFAAGPVRRRPPGKGAPGALAGNERLGPQGEVERFQPGFGWAPIFGEAKRRGLA